MTVGQIRALSAAHRTEAEQLLAMSVRCPPLGAREVVTSVVAACVAAVLLTSGQAQMRTFGLIGMALVVASIIVDAVRVGLWLAWPWMYGRERERLHKIIEQCDEIEHALGDLDADTELISHVTEKGIGARIPLTLH